MSAAALEIFLARLYTDAVLRRAFLAAPDKVAREAGLDEDAVRSLVNIDREGLVLAVESYAHKRASHGRKDPVAGLRALMNRLRFFRI